MRGLVVKGSRSVEVVAVVLTLAGCGAPPLPEGAPKTAVVSSPETRRSVVTGRSEAAAPEGAAPVVPRAAPRAALEAELERVQSAMERARRELDLRPFEDQARALSAREEVLSRALEESVDAPARLEEARRELETIRTQIAAARLELAQSGQVLDNRVWHLEARAEEIAPRVASLEARAEARPAVERELVAVRDALERARAELAARGHPQRVRGLQREADALAGRALALRRAIDAMADAERDAELALRRLQDRGAIRREGDRLVITLPNDVLFAPSGELSAAQDPLETLATALRLAPDASLVVEAHSDGRGSREYNAELTRRRAEAVRGFLVSRGVEAGRVQAVGRGLESPLGVSDTSEGRAHNGRVEVIVSPSDAPALARVLDDGEAPV